MLTTNLDVSDGLCNGVMGTVVKISSSKTNLGQPQEIWIVFDNEKIGMSSRLLHPSPSNLHSNSVKIVPFTEEFKFQNQSITRHQYPLRLAWACTVHKTQGMTLASCVVSCRGTFLPGMQYVALSRATCLGGLYITEFDKKSLYCEPKVSNAMENMEELCVSHTPLLSADKGIGNITVIMHNIHSLQGHFQDLKQNPEMYIGDVIGLCETWLKKQTKGTTNYLDTISYGMIGKMTLEEVVCCFIFVKDWLSE